MIDLIYKTVQTILAKDRNGVLTPEEFNILANNSQDEIFREYFEDENRDKNRENRGLTNSGYSNLPANQRQRINKFSAISSVVFDTVNSRYDLPADLYMLEDDGITSSTNKVIEEVQRSKSGYLANSISGPTANYPTYELFGNHILVSPSTVTSNITVRYLRKPNLPKWTYSVVGGVEMFDGSSASFQDFDLHPSEFTNLVLRILTYFSINIKDIEVTQISEGLKDKANIKENS